MFDAVYDLSRVCVRLFDAVYDLSRVCVRLIEVGVEVDQLGRSNSEALHRP